MKVDLVRHQNLSQTVFSQKPFFSLILDLTNVEEFSNSLCTLCYSNLL